MYHETLIHPGETQTELSIAHLYTWKHLYMEARACTELSNMFAYDAMPASKTKGDIPSWENSTPRIPR